MNHNSLYKIFPACILIALFTQGCGGDFCNPGYDFQVDLVVTPNDFELHKGDTLSISMTTDNTMLIDSVGDRIVEFPNFDPNLYFLLPRIDSTQLLEGYINNEVIVDSFTYSAQFIPVETLSAGLFFFGIDTTSLISKLEYKIVLNQIGTYGLQINPSIRVRSRTIDFPNKCMYKGQQGDIDATILIDGARHRHYDNLDEHEKSNIDSYWSEREGGRRLSSSYYFKVVE